MRRKIVHDNLPVAGYTTPWSVRAGAAVDLCLSSAAPVDAVRILRLDVPKVTPMGWPIIRLEEPAHRSFEQGSYLHLSTEEMAKAGEVRAITIELLLTRNERCRAIFVSDGLRLELEDGVFLLNGGERLLLGPERVPTALSG